jgi:glutamate-1-semialdehyde aminotransferase
MPYGTSKGQALYERARQLIPGGTQLFSKRPERFAPGQWPPYYEAAKGCKITDTDGNHYVDMTTAGIGACVLGYADATVDAAVVEAIISGSQSTLNCPEEVYLAEKLVELHGWAGGVRYARSGGEALCIAVRIARAYTGRDDIMFCGYHGWHDFYLAANLSDNKALDGHLLPGLSPKGVPRALTGTATPFDYNDIRSLLEATEGKDIAAIVMEPVRSEYPRYGFLQLVRAHANHIGAVLIFDEITSGWRLGPGGAHLDLSQTNVSPDLAVFAKAMSNGYPMAAVIGRERVMQAAQDTFISSTSWTERIGPAAALATIAKYEREDVHEHLMAIGQRVQDGWRACATEAGLPIKVYGIPPLSHFEFEDAPDLSCTLFTQLMLERSYLAGNAFYPSYAHTVKQVNHYLDAAQEVFKQIANSEVSLKGDIRHPDFRRLT